MSLSLLNSHTDHPRVLTVFPLRFSFTMHRRKVSSLEKERQHLQSTVEALQEGSYRFTLM